MLSTPAGRPTSSAIAAIASAENGVCSAGLMTIVQPAASAGAALRVSIAAGKFHGVIAAQTPTGSFCTSKRSPARSVGITSPYARFPSSANQVKNDAAYAISPRASSSGFPCSLVSTRASSSVRAIIVSPMARTIVARSEAVRARQAGSAASAAAIAARVSTGPQRGTVPNSSPVDGFRTATVSSVAIHAPSMNARSR